MTEAPKHEVKDEPAGYRFERRDRSEPPMSLEEYLEGPPPPLPDPDEEEGG